MGTRKKVHKKIKKTIPKPEVYLTHEERQAKEKEERRLRYEDDGLRTVGVRFPGDPQKEYTYLMRLHDIGLVYLGMEVIVLGSRGVSRVAYITRIDKAVVMPSDYDEELKQITRKVVDL